MSSFKAGRRFDALVALKVMEQEPEEWPWECHVNDHNMDDGVWCYDCQMTYTDGVRIPPPYSTSDSAAMMVMRKMIKEGYAPRLAYIDGHWECSLEGSPYSHGAVAKAAPLAICIVALRAMGYEQRKECPDCGGHGYVPVGTRKLKVLDDELLVADGHLCKTCKGTGSARG